MECRSRRFQIGREPFITPEENKKSSSFPQFQQCLHPAEEEHNKLIGLWYCLRSLYAWICSTCICMHLCGICQTAAQCFQNTAGDQRTSAVGFGLQQHVNSPKTSTSVLYSSDSEGEGDSRVHPNNTPEDAIDDHEFAVVRFVDSVLYFYHLYRTHYSSFVQELLESVGNPGVCQSGPKTEGGSNVRGAYGHNIDPKERRPRIVAEGVRYLKRRVLKSRMTRVVGDDHKNWILRVALASRLGVFILQYLATNLPQAFKHNNDGFKFTPETTYGKLWDPLVNSTFGGFVNWDANYFLHISVYGYTSENITAFFPLLPMLLYIPSRIVYFLLGSMISMSSIVVVLGFCANLWLFVKCTENIYEFAKAWTNSQQMITTACIMFCFNPASIFFTGLYTETLFAYLTSHVILSLCLKKPWEAVIYTALSGLCRSNGILNLGFVAAFTLQRELCRKDGVFRLVNLIFRGIVMLLLSLLPFLLFQVYCIRQFCREHKLYEPKEIPLYCLATPNIPLVPWALPYSYVQKKYWNVGFLEYFEWKQLPNFMLAAPCLFVLGSESYKFMIYSVVRMKTQMTLDGIYDVFQAAHGLFLTVFCFLFVHVQVSTRMIMAACPYLYLYLAYGHEKEVEKFRSKEIPLPTRSLAVTLWCLLYYLIGTIGFSLGLPWT